MILNLKATKRDPQQKEKERELDGKQMIKAIVYGNKFGSHPIWIVKSDFLKAYKIIGKSSLLDLVIDDQKPLKVLVKEIQVHPVYMTAKHVDFQVIDITKPFQVSIPLVFIGSSEAVKQGGDLIKILSKVEIECLPTELPHEIEVNLEDLKTISDKIKISDLNLPASAKVTNQELDDVIVEVKTHLAIVEEEDDNNTPQSVDDVVSEADEKKKEKEAEETKK